MFKFKGENMQTQNIFGTALSTECSVPGYASSLKGYRLVSKASRPRGRWVAAARARERTRLNTYVCMYHVTKEKQTN